ncbi:DUF6005 family protein [Longirhabdus pacifica]|uniref:DUF6005 family protein n=1 Tax=Longirhabdus pacifica TaxID=2305227 RepID=UPI001008F209|nr:DUF6005 family protein [Longirhabdus pacifica]
MIHIHCFLDCLAAIIKPKVNPNPLYFGSWDTPFAVTEQNKLTYYSTHLSSEKDRKKFETIYQGRVIEVYDHEMTKEENYEHIIRDLALLPSDWHMVVQIDLFYIPYESKTYQKKHQPHFVIIRDDKNGVHVHDPSLGFEGSLEEQIIHDAIAQNAFGAAYIMDTSDIVNPTKDNILSWIMPTLQADQHSLTHKVLEMIEQIQHGRDGMELKSLPIYFGDLGILAKWKKSYIPAFQYFQTDNSEHYITKVNELTSKWNGFAFQAIRASVTNNTSSLEHLKQLVHDIEQREHNIKSDLISCIEQWKVTYE